MSKSDSDLFFCCSLIEYIGRVCKLKRSEVVNALSKETIKRIYQNADILHCEPIAKTADVYIHMCNMQNGEFDNVKNCRYNVPDYWVIGEVYSRLIKDIGGETLETLGKVYSSFISDSISDYNTDFYYQSRDYICECYRSGKIL